MAVAIATLGVSSCARFPTFQPGPVVSQSPDSLATVDTVAVAGRVLVTVEEVRYRARWALAACEDALRLQVFYGDGRFVADIALRDGSMTVLLPQTMECHRGPARVVPVDSLLGIPVPWEPALTALHAAIWPSRLSPPWTSGTLGRRRGWYCPEEGVFLEPDPVTALPRYVAWIRGDERLTVEVARWAQAGDATFPSEILLSWPGRRTRMWLDLDVRKTEGVSGALLDIVCPPGSSSTMW